MTIPTAYTATALAEYQHQQLGPVADALQWTVADGNYDEAVIDALLLYGVDTLTDATDIKKLRALAAVAVWRAAKKAAAGLINFSSFGDRYELGTIQARIKEALGDAEAESSAYLTSSYGVIVTPVSNVDDPYAWKQSDEDALTMGDF